MEVQEHEPFRWVHFDIVIELLESLDLVRTERKAVKVYEVEFILAKR